MRMAVSKASKPIRRSVSISPDTHRKIERMARQQKRSASRVLEHLIEKGISAEQEEERRFLALVDQLQNTKDEKVARRLKEELARLTFGS